MAKVIKTETESQVVSASQSWWQIVLIGMSLGIVYWGLTIFIERYIINPIYCRSISDALTCLNSTSISGDIATIIVAIIGITVLLRSYMARPLVVALASGLALWGLALWTTGLQWFEAIFWSVMLYVLAYTLFSWIARYTKTIPVLIAALIMVVFVRMTLIL